MSFVLGLTGSIGMGKSTTARMFRDEGCDVWDADAAVHRLYAAGGIAVEPMTDLFPAAIEDGAVSREKLKEIIARDSGALARIEAVVHPLVARDRQLFLDESTADIVVLDIPLLFENGNHSEMDAVAVVTTEPEMQRARVLDRPGMTQARFEYLLAQQMPDEEKRKRADFVIRTHSLEAARQQVKDIVATIRRGLENA